MKNYNGLVVILLAVVLGSCSGAKEDFFSINEGILKAQYTQKESVGFEISNLKSENVDSVVYRINGKRLGASKGLTKFVLPLLDKKFGVYSVLSTTHFEGATEIDSTRIEVISDFEPKLLSYEIVNTFVHDTTAYTQGLEFYKGVLYEGTGQYKESTLRKTDYRTGKTIVKIDLDPKYFGEGITFLNNKIYQLTWQENTAFVYDASTLKLLQTLPYTKKMDGWGLTNDGKKLYMTDSSETVHVLDPVTLSEVDYINVYSGATKIEAVNEMEWIDGKIYGNIYQKDAIAIINPMTGAVEGIINLADLKNKITNQQGTDVLNGIAYNPATKTIFVTGKNWDKIFEIRIK